jgi:hypothetical protein
VTKTDHLCGLAQRLPPHTCAGQAHSDTQRVFGRARAQQRLPVEVRQRDLGLTPNQVWGLTKTDEEWSAMLVAALTETRRDDLKHGTNAAYVAGCVCGECREHQRRRMARNR